VKIAAVLIVRNEAHVLEPCLESIRHVVDEIVVMDTGSTDETITIAKRFTPALQTMSWPQSFSIARNEAVSHATADWILQIDADERLVNPPGAREKLEAFAAAYGKDSLGTVAIESPFVQNGQRQKAVLPVARVFARGHAHYEGPIHEQLVLESGERNSAQTGLRFTHLGYDVPPEEASRKAGRNRALLRQAIEQEPDNAYYRYQLGKTCFSSGQFAVAAIHFRDALALAGKSPSPLAEIALVEIALVDCAVTLAYALASTGRHAEALRELQTNARVGSAWADYHHACGYVHLQLGNLPESRTAYERALAIGPDHEIVCGTGGAASHYHLGLLSEAEHNLQDAAHHYGEALLRDPRHQPTLSRLADWTLEYDSTSAPAIIERADASALVHAWSAKALDQITSGASQDAKRILLAAKTLSPEIYDGIAKRLTGA